MRILITVCCAILGFFAGMVADAIAIAAFSTPPTILAWVGLVGGGVSGYLLARQSYPKRRT